MFVYAETTKIQVAQQHHRTAFGRLRIVARTVSWFFSRSGTGRVSLIPSLELRLVSAMDFFIQLNEIFASVLVVEV